MDVTALRGLAATWERAAERSRTLGRNPNLRAVSKDAGEAAATTYLGCSQALRGLLDEEGQDAKIVELEDTIRELLKTAPLSEARTRAEDVLAGTFVERR